MENTIVSTAKYGTIITAVGKAKIAAALLTGTKLDFVYAAVGDGGGSYYMPSAEQTALKNECWRGKVEYSKINTLNQKMIDVKAIVPAEVGGFWVREAGLFDAEGDMIAICNTPDAEKVSVADGASFPMDLMLHIVVEDANAVQISITGGRSLRITTVLIPAGDWKAASKPNEDYQFICDVPNADSKIELVPNGTAVLGNFKTARRVGLVNGCETFDGYIRFFSKRIPKDDIQASIQLLGAENHAVTPPDGYIVSGSEDANQMLEGVFGSSTQDQAT